MTGRDVEQMTLAELQALLQRMQARVDQLIAERRQAEEILARPIVDPRWKAKQS